MEEKRGRFAIIERIKEAWAQLPTEQKSKFIKIGAALLLIIIGLLGYVWSRGGEKREPVGVDYNRTQDKGINIDLLQKTQYYEAQRQLEELKKELEQLKRERTEMETRLAREEGELREREWPTVPPPPPPTQMQVSNSPCGVERK